MKGEEEQLETLNSMVWILFIEKIRIEQIFTILKRYVN